MLSAPLCGRARQKTQLQGAGGRGEEGGGGGLCQLLAPRGLHWEWRLIQHALRQPVALCVCAVAAQDVSERAREGCFHALNAGRGGAGRTFDYPVSDLASGGITQESGAARLPENLQKQQRGHDCHVCTRTKDIRTITTIEKLNAKSHHNLHTSDTMPRNEF